MWTLFLSLNWFYVELMYNVWLKYIIGTFFFLVYDYSWTHQILNGTLFWWNPWNLKPLAFYELIFLIAINGSELALWVIGHEALQLYCEMLNKSKKLDYSKKRKEVRNAILIALCGLELARLWITRAEVGAWGIVGVLGGLDEIPIKHTVEIQQPSISLCPPYSYKSRAVANWREIVDEWWVSG